MVADKESKLHQTEGTAAAGPAGILQETSEDGPGEKDDKAER